MKKVYENKDIKMSLGTNEIDDLRDVTNKEIKKEVILWITTNNQKLKYYFIYMNKFLSFLSLFTCHMPTVKSIIYTDNNNKFILHLDKTLKKYNDPNKVWDWTNFLDDLNKMFKKTLADDIHRLIKNFSNDIDNDLNPEIALINYVGSIEYYMAGKKYTNSNKVIQDLSEKLQRFINKVSDYLDKEYFIDKIYNTSDDKHPVSYFVNQVRDTRDYLLHGDKKNSQYLLTDRQIPEAVNNLKKIIYMVILKNIDFNDEEIGRYSQINSIWGLKFFKIV